MTILDRVRGLFERRRLDDVVASALLDQRSGALSNLSLAGVPVTPTVALQSSAVYACVRLLAESVAMLPLVLYRRDGRSRVRATEHPLYPLLHDAPNPLMTSYEYRQTLMGHLCLRGNAYSYIEYDRAGRVSGLWLLNPDMVSLVRDRQTGELLYAVQLPPEFGGEMRVLPADMIWHLRGLSGDGIMGYSPLRLATQAIGLSIAAEAYGAAFFANSAEPGFVLIHPGKLSDTAYQRLRQAWERRHQGIERAHRVAILEEGLKPEKLGIAPEDAQFLETRKFQVTDIARIFRVPPHMIGDLERATFSNIEHMGIEFVTYSLMPWLVAIEQSIAQCLLLERERGLYYAKHNVSGLLRGDVQSRYQAYAIARQWGWMSVNDIRELEELNPLPDEIGEQYLSPLNMAPMTPEPPMRSRPIAGERGAASAAANVRDITRQRRRLMHEHKRLFAEALGRLYRRERQDILAGARRIFSGRSAQEFGAFLDDFYASHREVSRQALLSVLDPYAALVAAGAMDEIERDDYDHEALQRYVWQYAGAYAARAEYYSRERLMSAIRRAQREGVDILSELEIEMADWDTARAEADALHEAVRANGAVSQFVWRSAGVLYTLWVATGESCPICSELNGKRIPISGTFVSAGDVLNQGGEPYHVTQDHAHPPLHDGCDCMITAG